MSKDRMNENIKDLALVAGALFLGYLVLKSQGIIKPEAPVSSVVTPECPRGAEYSKGYFEDCASNYMTKFLGTSIFPPQDSCVCLTKK